MSLLKIFSFLFFASIIAWSLVTNAYAQSPPSAEEEAIVAAAEKLFTAMKAKDLPTIWQLLTKKTQEEICNSIVKYAAKEGEKLNRRTLMEDFAAGGMNAQAYWNAFLDIFDPDTVLNESSWQVVELKKTEAVIAIQHKRADHPARLIMKKEQGAWKVGLEETFGIIRQLIK